MTSKFIITVTLLTLFMASPAIADKGGKGKSSQHSSDTVTVVISGADRTALNDYLSEDYKTKCPPGLAKKNPACIPPGHHKKRYTVGQALPADILLVPLPADVRARLKPLPPGYTYIQVDRDILLISQVTKHVIDAVTLLSAVGN